MKVLDRGAGKPLNDYEFWDGVMRGDDDVMPVWWFGEGVALFPVASVAVARVV